MEAIVFAGCGAYLPGAPVDNDAVEAGSGYPRAAKGRSLDQWALEHHGGRLRHWAAPGEATSDLALQAAHGALAHAGVPAEALDLIVLSTFTSDHRTPSSASRLHAALGCRAKFLQIDAACTGFIDALWIAAGLMRQHRLRHALVAAADVLSRLSDPRDWLSRSVFGDGAGAVVLAAAEGVDAGLREFYLQSDGSLGDLVLQPAGGSRMPHDTDSQRRGDQYWRLQFDRIKPWAVQRLAESCRCVTKMTGIAPADVAWWLPHQASASIVDALTQELQIDAERVLRSFAHTGNVSGASIPLLLDAGWRSGLFKPGDWIVMPAVGAGMAWGALTYRWPEPAGVKTNPKKGSS
jgi:3-oxoacyl-[acyl-carrier-protein] synthase-3